MQAVGGGLSGLAAQFSDKSALEVCIHVMRYTNRRLFYFFLLFYCTASTLHYRRIPGNMTQTYKTVTGKYDLVVSPTMVKASMYVATGNNLQLQKHRFN